MAEPQDDLQNVTRALEKLLGDQREQNKALNDQNNALWDLISSLGQVPPGRSVHRGNQTETGDQPAGMDCSQKPSEIPLVGGGSREPPAAPCTPSTQDIGTQTDAPPRPARSACKCLLLKRCVNCGHQNHVSQGYRASPRSSFSEDDRIDELGSYIHHVQTEYAEPENQLHRGESVKSPSNERYPHSGCLDPNLLLVSARKNDQHQNEHLEENAYPYGTTSSPPNSSTADASRLTSSRMPHSGNHVSAESQPLRREEEDWPHCAHGSRGTPSGIASMMLGEEVMLPRSRPGSLPWTFAPPGSSRLDKANSGHQGRPCAQRRSETISLRGGGPAQSQRDEPGHPVRRNPRHVDRGAYASALQDRAQVDRAFRQRQRPVDAGHPQPSYSYSLESVQEPLLQQDQSGPSLTNLGTGIPGEMDETHAAEYPHGAAGTDYQEFLSAPTGEDYATPQQGNFTTPLPLGVESQVPEQFMPQNNDFAPVPQVSEAPRSQMHGPWHSANMDGFAVPDADGLENRGQSSIQDNAHQGFAAQAPTNQRAPGPAGYAPHAERTSLPLPDGPYPPEETQQQFPQGPGLPDPGNLFDFATGLMGHAGGQPMNFPQVPAMPPQSVPSHMRQQQGALRPSQVQAQTDFGNNLPARQPPAMEAEQNVELNFEMNANASFQQDRRLSRDYLEQRLARENGMEREERERFRRAEQRLRANERVLQRERHRLQELQHREHTSLVEGQIRTNLSLFIELIVVVVGVLLIKGLFGSS